MNVDNVTHHLTQEYIEIEQTDTSQLETRAMPFKQLKELFSKNTILLTSPENCDSLNHFKSAVIKCLKVVTEDDSCFVYKLKTTEFIVPEE